MKKSNFYMVNYLFQTPPAQQSKQVNRFVVGTIIAVIFMLLSFYVFAQNIGINTTGNTPNAKALLDIDGTTGGLLIPRMTTAQRNALAPAGTEESLLIYNTDTKCFEAYNATTSTWVGFGCIGCILPTAPTTGTHTPSTTQIVWNWNTSAGATGYKYNTVNNYGTATDNGASTSYTQTGLTCNTAYTLYVWAYNACGNSTAATLTQTTSSCCPCIVSGWTLRRPIAITNTSGSALTDYQVLINVTYDADMQPDFDDLRFRDGSCTALFYWIETYTASTSATVWVKVPSIPTPGGTTIYMYYGNAGAVSASDGPNTFLFFDNFEYTDSPTNHGWSITGPGSVSTDATKSKEGSRSLKISAGAIQYTEVVRAITLSANVAVHVWFYDDAPSDYNKYERFHIRNGVTCLARMGTYDNTYYDLECAFPGSSGVSRASGWHIFKYLVSGGTVIYSVDGSNTSAAMGSNVDITVLSGSSTCCSWYSTANWDEFFIRNYISPEPLAGAPGTEESCQ